MNDNTRCGNVSFLFLSFCCRKCRSHYVLVHRTEIQSSRFVPPSCFRCHWRPTCLYLCAFSFFSPAAGYNIVIYIFIILSHLRHALCLPLDYYFVRSLAGRVNQRWDSFERLSPIAAECSSHKVAFQVQSESNIFSKKCQQVEKK